MKPTFELVIDNLPHQPNLYGRRSSISVMPL